LKSINSNKTYIKLNSLWGNQNAVIHLIGFVIAMGIACIVLNLLYSYFIGEIGMIITTMKIGLTIGSIFSAEEFGSFHLFIAMIIQ
jgi:hypothetical protein